MQPPSALLCPKCAGEVREDWKICPACLSPLANGNDTRTVHSSSSSASSSSSGGEEGRFPAGAVIAGRYRILGLIGHGGMGEVYRAYDLILNQAVALKFLAAAPEITEAALARFRNEVRIARQVSHPNVCRVYDIGSIEGQHFLSMEYLDGEDLDSLLRRIGRLPQDKSIEFARKICAGLAAAHERGVLHRDLKPANIMIDGRGQVRITDFGLAALAAEIPLSDLRSGTPAYMSPEQKAGREVTTRSDIYSLGLVLHEMFTGKRRSGTETNPSDLVRDLDPAVERVILRCLEEDPKRRPSSALNVSMALPGGDPIAAALAAGETPSPEMVAASGEKEGFAPRSAVLCFVAALVSVIAGIFVQQKIEVIGPGRAEINIPAEALAFRAQDFVKQFGYSDPPAHFAYGFTCCDTANLRYIEDQGPRRDAFLAAHQPPVVSFWYRQAQGDLIADLSNGIITYNSPANIDPEMIRLALDAKGRLISFEARPKASGVAPASIPAYDWSQLFTAAGLDLARFTTTTPVRTPPMAFDSRAAWLGSYSSEPRTKLRVEAAAWQGRPVYFDVALNSGSGVAGSAPSMLLQNSLDILLVGIVIGAVWIAWHNLKLGRGDKKGAAKLAWLVFGLFTAGSILRMSHVAGLAEIGLLAYAASIAGLAAVLVWLAYIAIEPYARRNWPDSLISWNRILNGRFRDPLVASHALAGITVCFAGIFIVNAVNGALSAHLVAPGSGEVAMFNSPAGFAGRLLAEAAIAPVDAVAFLMLLIMLRLFLRKVWIADWITAIVFGVVSNGLENFAVPYRYAATLAILILYIYGFLWVFRRFGFVAMLAMWLADALTNHALSLTSWYAGRMLLPYAIMIAIAAWSLWVVVSAKRSEFSSHPA